MKSMPRWIWYPATLIAWPLVSLLSISALSMDAQVPDAVAVVIVAAVEAVLALAVGVVARRLGAPRQIAYSLTAGATVATVIVGQIAVPVGPSVSSGFTAVELGKVILAFWLGPVAVFILSSRPTFGRQAATSSIEAGAGSA